jgi:hypothetical protein
MPASLRCASLDLAVGESGHGWGFSMEIVDGGGGGPKRAGRLGVRNSTGLDLLDDDLDFASGPPGQSARAELVCAGAGDRIIMGEDLEAS